MAKFMYLASIALLILFSGKAVAGCGEKHAKAEKINMDVAQHIFEKADANKDGILTQTEHDAAGLGKYGTNLPIFDVNNDGQVTLREYRKIISANPIPIIPLNTNRI